MPCVGIVPSCIWSQINKAAGILYHGNYSWTVKHCWKNSTVVRDIPAAPTMRAVAWGLKNYDTKCFDWGEKKTSSSVISGWGTKNCSLIDSTKGNV